MKNLLYIGNALSSHGNTITSIETLSKKLSAYYKIKTASTKKNKVFRLLDMMYIVFRNRSWADMVLIDTYSTLNFYYAFAVSQLCRILGIKYISFLKGGNLEHRLKNNKFLSKLMFKHAYLLIAPSYFLMDLFEEYGYNKLICIPNTIEIKDYDYKEADLDTIRLLWVRSLSKIYNPEMAVEVLDAIIKLGFKAELCMVGPDKDGSMGRVKNLADSKNVQVKFTGNLTREEWRSLSEKYNIFINTTDFDNTPVSVMEAMALGLPVVSTNVGGLPYLIQDHYDGMLVKKADVNGMVLAILNLYHNPEMARKISRQARIKVEQFDWEIIKEQRSEILA
ncbi:MAG: glycosyltransferase family 4 protein [Flavobacteriaceae bacterium]|nr:glycosyltransferase family 4 protein [Flavobacteriaceae bacterium]